MPPPPSRKPRALGTGNGVAETQEQQNRLLRNEEVAAHFGKTRIQNVEALRGGEGKKKLLWPDHLPDVDEGRFAPEREAHRSGPGGTPRPVSPPRP